MADDIHYSTIFKVGLYGCDVGTDWYNGYNFYNFTQNVTKHLSPSTGMDVCAEDHSHNPNWGTWTIGMSWVPALFGGFSVLMGNRSMKNVMLFLPRLIVWPILVPIYM